MANVTHSHDNDHDSPTLRELQAIRRELAALRDRFDDFATVYLAARFPFGKPVDRWRTRR